MTAPRSRRRTSAVDDLITDTVGAGARLHVDDIVLCELVWVLSGAYRFDQATIASALEIILSKLRAGCASTMTFDRALAGSAGFTLL